VIHRAALEDLGRNEEGQRPGQRNWPTRILADFAKNGDYSITRTFGRASLLTHAPSRISLSRLQGRCASL